MTGVIDRLYGVLAFGLLAVALLLGGIVYLTPGERAGETADADVTVVAEGLDVPWGVAFLPDGDMLVTERPGTLLRMEREDGGYTRTYSIDGVTHQGEGGLLGVEVHPRFAANHYVYLYMTRTVDGGLRNRVVRYTLQGDRLANATTLIDGLPGAVYHDGGRIEIGPDGMLYITAGDATHKDWAQQTDILAGKILRLQLDGSVPPANPFDNPVYSYGHRNPQGLAWVGGQLWATEHGDQHHDELNRIVRGGNYGWPVIEADTERDGMRTPAVYAEGTTWAPAGAAYHDGSIFFAGLRGSALYEAELENGTVTGLEKHLQGFGRLRAVEQGPDGMLYISTSNTDGRGVPRTNDDRILRVDPGRWT